MRTLTILFLFCAVFFAEYRHSVGFLHAAEVLPPGVKAVWDMDKAYKETTPTRERISINGLWQWQPALGDGRQQTADGSREAATASPPTENWGYFKVPGSIPMPGFHHWMQKDSQQVYAHPAWQNARLRDVTKMWYQREIEIPANWTGRRILLQADYVNSRAVVYIAELEGSQPTAGRLVGDSRQDDQTHSPDASRLSPTLPPGGRQPTLVGEILYPAGTVDLTEFVAPGKKYLLTLEVTALPLAEVIAHFGDTNAPRQTEATVNRKGLCGDVWLLSEPNGARITDVKIETSVRNEAITVTVALEDAIPFTEYSGRAGATGYFFYVRIYDSNGQQVDEFGSHVQNEELGSISHTRKWKPDKLWDIHTPENMYTIDVELTSHEEQADRSAIGRRYDRFHPIRFGYREFWIDGRDLYLNGTRIWLSCVPLPNAQVGAAFANYEAAKETMLRLKSFGVNFVYTHNYDCNPGSFISFAEILRAADDVGMLVSFAMPHFGHFVWETGDESNGYARIASFLVNEAQNHPSVIFYSMSHNATGYAEDMNPFLMDGIAAPRSRWGVNNLARASRAEAIVQKLDPSRIIYHHASGNLGPMHISNFYANWVPIQEMSDWFEHWGTVGTKPMFTCEYGVPFTWDWAMYRGWYKGVREFGSAPVPWEFANAEWNAQFVGDVAFNIGEPEKRNLRWEAQKFREGAVWHRWDYPHVLGAREFTDQDPILAAYITDNWRAFRTWGLSINSYWEHSRLWSLRPGVDKSRKDYTTDWENLQRPGFSPDFQESRFERIDLAFERDDWIPSEGAEALIRNNMPLLGYIAGKEGDFTEKGHNFFAGELVEKQLVTVNNSRETVFDTFQFTTDFSLNGMGMAGSMNSSNDLKTGTLHQLPVIFSISDNAPPGAYDIEAEFGFFMVERYADANPDEDDMDIEIQTDTFTIHVMPPLPSLPSLSIALFDPHGETAKMLDEMGVRYETADGRRQIAADASGAEAPLLPSAVSGLPSDAVLIIGKNALSLHDDGIDLSAVPDGLRVIVFEQSAEVLEKRLGLRTAEYGLRNVFKRVPDHPLLENIGQENLRDWRGSATLLPVPMEYETNDNVFNGVPTAEWCGITVPRVWRSSNRGSVASVLIEKPTCGDFLPILDGGFSLQYSPLMEYRHGKRMILFCQMDVTGRTENDPAALHLVNNILRYVNGWKPRTGNLRVLYRGDDALGKFLNKLGAFYDNNYERQRWTNLLVIGPNFEQSNAGDMSEVRRRWGAVLAVGLNEDDLKQAFPDITFKEAEHISTYFEPFGMSSPLRGISPADVHNRDPRVFPLITDENIAVGNGILGVTDEGRTVIFGMAPWQFASAEFPDGGQSFKRTFRRSAFMLSRILGNMNVDLRTPLVERFHGTVGANEMRWLDGLYLDEPEEWDDPYRFFRW